MRALIVDNNATGLALLEHVVSQSDDCAVAACRTAGNAA